MADQFHNNDNIPGASKAPTPKSPLKDSNLRILFYAIVCGLVTILFVSIYAAKKPNSFWPVLGLSTCIAFAAVASGGFLGFLFGIPRSLQRTPDASGAAVPAGRDEKPYVNNTNLEQISDWLTKIIVGVSLTQLPAIEKRLDQLCVNIAKAYLPYTSYPTFGYVFAGAILAFFFLCGFLLVYIWAKIFLLRELTQTEKDLADIFRIKEEVKQEVKQEVKRDVAMQVTVTERENRIRKLGEIIQKFRRDKNRISREEAKDPDLAKIIQKVNPKPITYVDDAQKGRWGGLSTAGPYSLTAAYTPLIEDDIETGDYIVTLTVQTSDPVNAPLKGDVYFFLHESFYPDIIEKTPAMDGLASISVTSFEAFTVGAVANEGDIKLELDLNLDSICPEDYKYPDQLKTIDQLETELAELEKQASMASPESISTGV